MAKESEPCTRQHLQDFLLQGDGGQLFAGDLVHHVLVRLLGFQVEIFRIVMGNINTEHFYQVRYSCASVR